MLKIFPKPQMPNKKICCIVGAGETERLYINRESFFIIAADGGLERLGDISPDIIVGDFDSLGFVPNSQNTVILPVEKDVTDTAYAASMGEEKGFDTFVIYGGTGGRPDHTLANLSLLADLSKRGKRAFLIGEEFIITAITNGETCLPKHTDETVSVFSFSEKSFGVNIKGLKYCLKDYTLESVKALGVSNSFIGKSASVSVEKGTLIVMWQEKDLKNFLDSLL